MKQKAIVIGCYAVLILVGGLIGYLVAHSLMSLVMSSLFACLLLSCCFGIWKGYSPAYDAALVLIFCLFLFFGYRFLITYKLAPSGILALVSAGLLTYLLIARKQISRKI